MVKERITRSGSNPRYVMKKIKLAKQMRDMIQANCAPGARYKLAGKNMLKILTKMSREQEPDLRSEARKLIGNTGGLNLATIGVSVLSVGADLLQQSGTSLVAVKGGLMD